jgi:hypothetical protein
MISLLSSSWFPAIAVIAPVSGLIVYCVHRDHRHQSRLRRRWKEER